MKKIVLSVILVFPLFNFSQELKKPDLFDGWRFKKTILKSKYVQDSIKKQFRLTSEFKDKDSELVLRTSDFKLTENEFFMKTKRHILSSDYWTISKKNEIIIHESAPEDKEILQYLLKSPNKVVEKLNNGK
jgi:hypothetical protein